jgi:hypothetical protein
MIITLSEEEQGLFMKLCHKTPFTTGEVMARAIEIYEQNLVDDILTAIESLEEDQAIDKKYDVPSFEGTREALDKLTIIKENK